MTGYNSQRDSRMTRFEPLEGGEDERPAFARELAPDEQKIDRLMFAARLRQNRHVEARIDHVNFIARQAAFKVNLPRPIRERIDARNIRGIEQFIVDAERLIDRLRQPVAAAYLALAPPLVITHIDIVARPGAH